MWSYKANTKLSLPVKVAGKRVLCDFSDGSYYFHTGSEDIKNAIEESIYFKNGTVEYAGQAPSEVKITESIEVDLTVELDKEVEAELQNETDVNANVELVTAVSPYANITSIQQAKDVLRGEPYNVPFQQLNTPANILKKAEELGVVFPNL